MPQRDFILGLALSVEILFKWYLRVQLDMKEEVFLQVPVWLSFNGKQWESCLLHHSWLTSPSEGGLHWLLSVKSEVPGVLMRPLLQAVKNVKMFNKALNFPSLHSISFMGP